MTKGRLEAFSDGVIAIIITIMVLEIKIPHGEDWVSLQPLSSVFLSYVLSFIVLGIYWINHHHLFQVVRKINGWALWANLHLLLWVSLIPFVSGWMGENHFATLPVALYGFVLLMAAVSYFILTLVLLNTHSHDSELAIALGRDYKGKTSLLIYAVAVPLAFFNSWLALSLYVLVTIIWLVPDRRFEKALNK